MNSFLNTAYQDLNAVAAARREAYAKADPFPHLSFPDFFNPVMLEEVLALYVRDIESDGDEPLNPVLEEEITKFLLKDSKDEESL